MYNNNGKKRGFTLAEIVIALFIVALIAMLSAPIISRQLSTSDDYAYYMAFKSIEKMAAQIAILGDDDEIATPTSYTFKDYLAEKFQINKVSKFIASIPQNFAKSEEYVFRSLFPKAFAATFKSTSVINSWDSAEYDYIWLGYAVCNGGNYLKKREEVLDPVTGLPTGTYNDINYSEIDFNCCYGYTKGTSSEQTCGGNTIPAGVKANDVLKNNNLIPEQEVWKSSYDQNSITTKFAEAIKTQTSPDAKAFCTGDFADIIETDESKTSEASSYYDVVRYTSSWTSDSATGDPEDDEEDDDEYDVPDDIGSYEPPPSSSEEGECKISKYTEWKIDQIQNSDIVDTRPEFGSEYCQPSHFQYGKYNAGKPESIECLCLSGKVQSVNNERVCCNEPSGNESPYAVRNSSYAENTENAYSCVYCSADFNYVTNSCCPENSMFNGSECMCISGYTMNDAKTACILTSCPRGYSLDETTLTCVKNPPLIKAKKFCELVYDNWNVAANPKREVCGTMFSKISGSESYGNEDVYNAVLGAGANSTTMYSTNSKSGAFLNLAPHVVLANGVKLWILGDKAASIPGLSFTPVGASSTQNMCVNLKKTSKAACDAANGYFCGNAGDNNCYTLDNSSLLQMGDARNCCSSPDNSDIAYEATRQGSLPVAADKRVIAVSGFTILADINGERGSGTLWEDVFPFFIASNGKVYPGYPMDSLKGENANTNELYKGGNSEKLLPTDVYYYETNEAGTARVKKVAFNSVSYARAMCSARQISPNSPYCLNLGEKFYAGGSFKAQNGDMIEITSGIDYIGTNTNTDPSLGTVSANPCDHYRCFVTLRRKTRLF